MNNETPPITLDLPPELPSGRIAGVVAAAAHTFGLTVGMEGTLRSYPGAQHWHLRQTGGRGTLELTWWPQAGRFWPKVNAERAAPWIEETLAPLMNDIERRLQDHEHEDVASILGEAGLPSAELSRLLAKGNKRIYATGSSIVQLWYGRNGGTLGRSSIALEALAGAVRVPELLYTNLIRPEPPYQAQITTRLPGITLEDAWPGLSQPERRALVQQLAGLMEAMHSVEGERLAPLAALDGPLPWAGRCRAELDARLARARRTPGVDGAGLARVADFVKHHRAELDHPPECLVHTDIHFGNLLVDHGAITGLIDFENAEVGGRDRDAYMLIGDALGEIIHRGGEDDLHQNYPLQAVRWLQEDYPALYSTPAFSARQFLYLMLEPEAWNGSSIEHMAAGWIRVLDGGWIERWFPAP